MGIDFKGKTNSAVARPPLSERVAGIFLGRLEASSLTVVSFSAFSVETVGLEVSKFM